VIRVSIGGDTLRMKFSNDFGTSPVTLNSAKIAVSKGSGAIDTATTMEFRFGGNAAVTIGAGASVYSDPLAIKLLPRMDVAITIRFGQISAVVTGHPGSRTTSYLLAGDRTGAGDFTGSAQMEHWYIINTLDVKAPETAAAVAIIGNSITDGRGSTTDGQDRWPDVLSAALLGNPANRQVGVLNQGIGGNCVLAECIGPSGISRYPRDILGQQGVAWVIVCDGVNDIGAVNTQSQAATASQNLIDAYRRMAADAHAKSMKIYGATIMPFNGNAYFNTYSESCRRTVNAWIRAAGNFDAVIDFDKLTRSAADTTRLGIASYQNDGLHPTAPGYRLMGESIPLDLFAPSTVRAAGRVPSPGYSAGEIHFHGIGDNARIDFALSGEARVSLKAYSPEGRLAAVLADGMFPAGGNSVAWRIGDIGKGAYLYVLRTDGIATVKKRILPGP